jgi:O-antigen/teichoic acid export membrane protein
VEGSSGLDILRQKFLESMRLSVPLVALCCFGLFTYGPSFLDRWLGPEFADSGTVLRLLVAPFGLWLMQLPATNLLLALHKHQLLMKATLIAGVGNLVLSLILASKIGFFGVVISTMIDMSLFYGLLVPWLAARASRVPLAKYYLQGIARPLLAISLPLIIYSVRSWIEADYLRLGFLSGGMIVTAVLAFGTLVLSPAERSGLWQFWSRQ